LAAILLSKGWFRIYPFSMRQPHCLIEEVARRLAEDPELRAVTLDAKQHRLAYALQPAREEAAGDHGLAMIVESYESTETGPPCLRGSSAACEACDGGGASLVMPRGIRVVPMPGSVLIEKESCPTAPRFWKWREVPWVKLRRGAIAREEAGGEDDWRRALALAGMCGIWGALGWAAPWIGMNDWAWVMFVLSYVTGAWHPAQEVWPLMRRGVLDVHFLMLAVAAGAASIGQWGEGAILLFLFSLSGALEDYAMARTRREISALFREAPKVASVIQTDGTETPWPVENLRPGLRIRVRPGETFPVDATILDGTTSADESNLTGEAIPIDKSKGDAVARLALAFRVWSRRQTFVSDHGRCVPAIDATMGGLRNGRGGRFVPRHLVDHIRSFTTQYSLGGGQSGWHL
jgi:Cd2+/Zn2+-exporting ATPase